MVPTLAAELERAGIVLPLEPNPADVGSVRDAEGREVFVVDVNGHLDDDEAMHRCRLLAEAINRGAGLPRCTVVPLRADQIALGSAPHG